MIIFEIFRIRSVFDLEKNLFEIIDLKLAHFVKMLYISIIKQIMEIYLIFYSL